MAYPTWDDLAGRPFGSLEAVSRVEPYEPRYMWLCSCVCGRTVKVNRGALVNGRVQSCGCRPGKRLAKEIASRDQKRLLRSKRQRVQKAIQALVAKIWREAIGWTEGEVAECVAAAMEACRVEHDRWKSKLVDPEIAIAAANKPGGATMAEIMGSLQLPEKCRNKVHQLQIASMLRTAGFVRWKIRRQGRYVAGWISPGELRTAL